MQETSMDEGELSLRDLLQILKPYQRSLILTPLLFGVMALAVTFMMTPRYEASGIIQIAQLNTAILEPSSVMIARMNDPSFRAQLEILIPNELSHTNKTEFNSLRVKKVKDTELVAFEVQGRTPERALLKADAVVRNLQKTHARIYSANINNIQTQLDQINSQIDQLHQESKLVNNKLSQQRDLNNYTAVLYLLSMQDNASQLKQLTERKLALESSLNPAFTFNTSLVGNVTVSDDPVSPNRPLIVGVAILMGLLLSLLAVFMRHQFKQGH